MDCRLELPGCSRVVQAFEGPASSLSDKAIGCHQPSEALFDGDLMGLLLVGPSSSLCRGKSDSIRLRLH
tara:strand:- start:892 stop:1098 length:207 start_codon:yes stop_codon:yes gene_type:complete